MSDMTLQSNMQVQVTVTHSLIGRIEEIQTVAEMRNLPEPGLPFAGNQTLLEWGVSRVAKITYRTSPDQQFMFAALEIGGEWFDLQRQKLELEVIGLYG
jgi:hypothetical protein